MYQKRRVHVLNSDVCYIDTRAGEETVLFLHGNLSYSFTWRNIIPRVDGFARCLAPDLIGHGDSSRDPEEEYSFKTHYSYLSEWLEAVHLPKQFIIVGHDWGALLGAYWAANHPDRVKGFVHMEGIISTFPTWSDLHLDPVTEDFFRKLRNVADKETEAMALEKNIIIETNVNKLTLEKKLSDPDVSGIKRPYVKPGQARKSALAWIRQLPVQEEGPDDVIKITNDCFAFMENSGNLPKLYIQCDPGVFSTFIDAKTRNWPNQKKHTIAAKHFPQEDDPENVGSAIANFVKGFIQLAFRR